MANEKLFKTLNRKWLIGYLTVNIVLFGILIGFISPSYESIEEIFTKLHSPSGILPILLFPLTIVFEGIFPSNLKYIIIFLKLNNPLPASKAFSYFAKRDPRIDESELDWLFPDGRPDDPKEQNRQWYKLFRKYESKPIVQDSHRNFLLTRDLLSLTLLIIPTSLVVHLFWDSPFKVIITHCLSLLIIAFIIRFSAKHYGERFVENVLVEATIGGNNGS